MMARRHGWELPAHTFQVVAITVFFLLSVAFYAFFSPFLGKEIYEHVAIGVYSFLALSVFVLYVRCTAIDPADPGILIEPGRVSPNRSHNGSEVPGNASSVSKSVFRNEGIYNNSNSGGCCSKVGGVLCGCIVKEDCRNDQDMQQGGEEEALFCTLCNAELSASVGAGLHYDRNDKLICTLRGKKAYPVASNRFVNVLLKGRCDIDKELNQPTPHGALELVWNILDFQKDQDVRLKVGYEIFDKIPYVQIRENNWTFNADVNGRWNVRYHL